jgi:transposase
LGYTDMRKGMDGLAMLVQDTLKQDAFSGHLFAFRGKTARIIKIQLWDGNGLRLCGSAAGAISRIRPTIRRPPPISPPASKTP